MAVTRYTPEVYIGVLQPCTREPPVPLIRLFVYTRTRGNRNGPVCLPDGTVHLRVGARQMQAVSPSLRGVVTGEETHLIPAAVLPERYLSVPNGEFEAEYRGRRRDL